MFETNFLSELKVRRLIIGTIFLILGIMIVVSFTQNPSPRGNQTALTVVENNMR